MSATNHNSIFRARDWLSTNQGPVFLSSVGSYQLDRRLLIDVCVQLTESNSRLKAMRSCSNCSSGSNVSGTDVLRVIPKTVSLTDISLPVLLPLFFLVFGVVVAWQWEGQVRGRKCGRVERGILHLWLSTSD